MADTPMPIPIPAFSPWLAGVAPKRPPRPPPPPLGGAAGADGDARTESRGLGALSWPLPDLPVGGSGRGSGLSLGRPSSPLESPLASFFRLLELRVIRDDMVSNKRLCGSWYCGLVRTDEGAAGADVVAGGCWQSAHAGRLVRFMSA